MTSDGGQAEGSGAAPAAPSPSSPPPEPAAPSAPEPPRTPVRATGKPKRWPLLVQGAAPALVAAALVLASTLGTAAFVAGVLLVQVFLVLAVLALVDAPASGGAFLLAVGTTVAADAVALLDDGDAGGLAGVVGVACVGALLHQLLRKDRSRVTEALADTFVVLVLTSAAACLIVLREVEGGRPAVAVALVAAGAALLAGRVGDRIAARPMLAVGSTRGWPGLLLGLGAGVAAAVLAAGQDTELLGVQAALLGLVAAATVASADLAVDLGAAELRSGWRDARRVAALRPSGLLMPFALLGPVALLAGRLVLT